MRLDSARLDSRLQSVQFETSVKLHAQVRAIFSDAELFKQSIIHRINELRYSVEIIFVDYIFNTAAFRLCAHTCLVIFVHVSELISNFISFYSETVRAK